MNYCGRRETWQEWRNREWLFLDELSGNTQIGRMKIRWTKSKGIVIRACHCGLRCKKIYLEEVLYMISSSTREAYRVWKNRHHKYIISSVHQIFRIAKCVFFIYWIKNNLYYFLVFNSIRLDLTTMNGI